MSEPIEPVLLLGDCVEVMRTMEANSVDAVVTDPPEPKPTAAPLPPVTLF